MAAFLCLACSAVAVFADEADDATAAYWQQEWLTVRPTPLGVKPLDRGTLASQRGGTESVSEMWLNGVVSDNKAINLTTGSNLITDGALTGASGLPMVIQNSGNNVLIQSATIVNIQVK
jgi:hypothetical protein